MNFEWSSIDVMEQALFFSDSLLQGKFPVENVHITKSELT